MNLSRAVEELRAIAGAPRFGAAERRRLRAIADAFEEEPLVGTVVAARLLGVHSPNTVKAWIARGQLPAIRAANGRFQIPLRAILDLRATKGQLEP